MNELPHKKAGLGWWDASVERAERHLKEDADLKLCFAMVGLTHESNLSSMSSGSIKLRKVVHVPGEIALARALRNQYLMSPLGRYMPAVSHELIVPLQSSDDYQAALTMAWAFFSTLRIKTNSDFLVPACIDCSWEAVPAFSDNSRHAQLL